MRILGYISAKQAAEDPPICSADGQEGPLTFPISAGLNISDHLNSMEGSKVRVRFLVPHLSQKFKCLINPVAVTELD